MNGRYILEGHTPKSCPGLMTWADWMETADRHVGLDIVGRYRVSTVFLGLDHSFGGDEPILFETMVFVDGGGTSEDVDSKRYSTWDEAEQGHRETVACVRLLGSEE